MVPPGVLKQEPEALSEAARSNVGSGQYLSATVISQRLRSSYEVPVIMLNPLYGWFQLTLTILYRRLSASPMLQVGK